jgi:hypothetical protein
MTRLTIILFCFTFPSTVAIGQRTPVELGQITFECFQKHQLDSFYTLKPTITDLTELGNSLGIDTASDQYQEFKKRYPLVIQNFKDKCVQLRNDTVQLGLSWTMAKVDTIEISTTALPLDNRNSNGKNVNITIIDIYLKSDGKRFKLTLGDVASYNGIWKAGNIIEITRR